jgi:hypothetical protein
MSKFKVGDRVRRIEKDHPNNHRVKVGCCGTVVDPDTFLSKVDWDNGEKCYCCPTMLELIETPNTMNLTVTKDKVVEAASKCSTANQVLRVMFPEAFEPEKPEPFKFGPEFRLDTASHILSVPVYIGNSLAPDGLQRRCLIIQEGWVMKAENHVNEPNRTILTFYKK